MNRAIRRHLRHWAYDSDSFIQRGRRQRMLDMIGLAALPARARIVDLGGTAHIWELVEHDFDVTLVNVTFYDDDIRNDPRYHFVEGDACDLSDRFEDGAFDFAFSNSTIEHIGDESRMRMFADEARRLGTGYWVQTPSKSSPIEAHSGIPFFWYLPMRHHLYDYRKRNLRVLDRRLMGSLFPDGTEYLERRLGFVKSITRYRPYA